VSPSYGIQGLKLNQLVPQEPRSGPEGGNTCVLSGSYDLPNLLRSVTSSHTPTSLEPLPAPTETLTPPAGNVPPLPQSLVRDAKVIEEAFISQSDEEEDISPDPITILCVALKDTHGNTKKFAFSNSELMPRGFLEQAEELDYAVIKADHAQAGGQFLQFLYQGQSQDPQPYTHLVGMGCSNLLCQECDLLFTLSLGEPYKEIIAAIDPAKTEVVQVNFAPASSSATDHNPFRFGIATKIIHEIVLGPAAVRPSQSENYYLPPILQKLIGHLTNHSTVNIASNSRYGPSSHKRRLQAGSSID
jgi:hypothetical protein